MTNFCFRGSKHSVQLLLMAALLTAAGFVGRASGNLVVNGDFEKPYKDRPDATRPDSWSPWTNNDVLPPQLDQHYLYSGGRNNSKCIRVGHSYSRFLELCYGSNNVARFRLDSDKAIAVSPSKFYKLSCWYKTDELVEGEQARIDVDMLNGSTFIDTRPYALPPSADWQEFTAYFVPISGEDRGFGGQDTTSIRIKLGMATSLGHAFYDDLSLTEVPESVYYANYPIQLFYPDSLTARRSPPPVVVSNPTETFITYKHNGAWWLIRPNGKPFWLRGVANVNVQQSINPEMYANLPAEFKSGGRTTPAYRLDCYRRLGSLGFNAGAITDGTDLETHPAGEVSFLYLCLDYEEDPFEQYTLRDKNGERNYVNKPMPDPYNESFWTALRAEIHAELDSKDDKYAFGGKSHPDMAGYFTDNEMGVEYLDEFIWSQHARAEFVNWVKARYGTIQAVNAAWTSQYATFNMTSFDDIYANRAKIIRHHLDDPLTPVLNDFIKKMLKDYYRRFCTIIREYEVSKLTDSNGDGLADQKHLIATNRFDFSRFPNGMNMELELAIDAIKELNAERPGYYFDLLAVTNYPGDQKFEGVTTRTNMNFLERLSQRCDLPVLVAEFGNHGRDCGFPTGNPTENDYGWYFRSVCTQADRAMLYDKMVRQYASSPRVVGAQWYQWYNLLQTPGGPITTPVNTESDCYIGRNSGLVDHWNNFYAPLSNQMRITNAAIDAAFHLSNRNAARSWGDYR